MGKRFIISDIHGSFLAFKQCLERCSFNYEEDELIVNGDVVDSFPESKECVDLILSLKNYVYIIGNHCIWARDYFNSDCNMAVASGTWLEHGGLATIASYKDGVPESHKQFFNDAKPYYVTKDNKLIIHAGYKPGVPLSSEHLAYYVFNRDLVEAAIKALRNDQAFNLPDFDEVFVGHTPTIRYFPEPRPVRVGNLYMIDTGAGFDGVLTIMDIDSKKYWQSDQVMRLYPDHKGRNKHSYNELNKL
jgi:serine/threonine protein phosphatase 1